MWHLLQFLVILMVGPAAFTPPPELPPPSGATRPAAIVGYWHGEYSDAEVHYAWLAHNRADGSFTVWFKHTDSDGTVWRDAYSRTWWVEGDHMVCVETRYYYEGIASDEFTWMDYTIRTLNASVFCYAMEDGDREFCSRRVEEGFRL